MMAHKSAQSALEFFVILGVVVLFLAGIGQMSFSLRGIGQLGRDVVISNHLAHVMANIINEVYLAGDGTQKMLDLTEVRLGPTVNITTGPGSISVATGRARSERVIIPTNVTMASFNATTVRITNDEGVILFDVLS